MDLLFVIGVLFSGLITVYLRTDFLKGLRANGGVRRRMLDRLNDLERIVSPFRNSELAPEAVRDFLAHEVPRVLQVNQAKKDIDEIALDVRIVPPRCSLPGLGQGAKKRFPKLLCKYGSKPLDDARNHPRYASHELVDIRFQVDDEWHHGFMQDVSVRGLCIFTPKEVEVGERIQIIVREIDGNILNGRVMWSRKDAQAARLRRVGIELEESIDLGD